MKNTTSKFKYYYGKKAILASWIGYYDFRIKLDTISSLEKNLEIIVDQDSEIVARRYDHPPDIKSYVENDGEWQLTEAGNSYSSKEKKELFDFIANIPNLVMEKLQDICDN